MKFMAQLCALIAFLSSGSAAYAQTPATSFEVGSIHVDKYGSGEADLPALILIPGLTNGAAVWAPTIHRFARSYTIYALTLAGFGGRASTAAPLLDKADADIVALIAKEHLKRPIVIGHSMGGHLAIRLAAEHSDKLRGIIAVDGLPVFPGFDEMTPEQRLSAATKMSAQIKSAATAEQFMHVQRTYIVPGLTLAKNVEVVARLSTGADPSATAQYAQEVLVTDLRPQLSKITVPVLELAPYDPTLDNSPPGNFATPTLKQTYYEALLKNDKTASVQMVQDSRHFIMYDQPDAFYVDVQHFIDLHK
ncbi:MAG: alpha/beta hydrolase [Candidatus Eremiobacteraeota bacterium]|nr:alpha/beta hydrolase [Candidatus Eremiobacteraeota bacterium]